MFLLSNLVKPCQVDISQTRVLTWHYLNQVGQNVNERMVTLGHAWVMRMYYDHLPKSRQQKLNQLERWAKSKRVGLWKTDNPIPPWQWRQLGSNLKQDSLSINPIVMKTVLTLIFLGALFGFLLVFRDFFID